LTVPQLGLGSRFGLRQPPRTRSRVGGTVAPPAALRPLANSVELRFESSAPVWNRQEDSKSTDTALAQADLESGCNAAEGERLAAGGVGAVAAFSLGPVESLVGERQQFV
jgi:hypothetical protein